MKSYSCLKIIPDFHSFSEALMSNLASRSFEWDSWEIREILFQSKNSKAEFCICLKLKEKGQKEKSYFAQATDSPTQLLLSRASGSTLKQSAKSARLSKILKTAKVLAERKKNSKGIYKEKNSDLFLTAIK
jgi:hypothetical protein